jgi:hypothetical protein
LSSNPISSKNLDRSTAAASCATDSSCDAYRTARAAAYTIATGPSIDLDGSSRSTTRSLTACASFDFDCAASSGAQNARPACPAGNRQSAANPATITVSNVPVSTYNH